MAADPDYLLLENGDRLLLEDGTGHVLLETSVAGAVDGLTRRQRAFAIGLLRRRNRSRRRK